ncbi:hypothetical protein GCM10027174_17880 [Salinifilum aidingensis]
MPLLTAAALSCAELVLGTGAAGVATTLAGALLGVLAVPLAAQLGLLLGAGLFGLRVRHVAIGARRALLRRRIGRTTLTVRALPVSVESEIGPWRPPVVLRSWLAGLLSALAGAAVVVASWWGLGAPLGRGFAVAGAAMMVAKLVPRRGALVTSTGWLLVGLPRMPEPRRSEFRASPLAAAVHDALQSGELDEAQRQVERLAAEHPDLDTALWCRVALAEARGEPARAAMLLLGRLSEEDKPPREMSQLLAGLAGAGASAVEAGAVPAEQLLPTAREALRDAVRLGYPELQLCGTRAVFALLDGDPDEAERLARIGAEFTTSPLTRADDCATLARARMARRDHAAAREALRLAEESAAWWPRVRRTRERLDIT